MRERAATPSRGQRPGGKPGLTGRRGNGPGSKKQTKPKRRPRPVAQQFYSQGFTQEKGNRNPTQRAVHKRSRKLVTSVLETANAGEGPGPTPGRTDGQTAERPRRGTPSRRGASATGAPEKLGNAPPGERSRTQTRTRQPSPLHETLTDKHAR